jgi:hypothetical protein
LKKQVENFTTKQQEPSSPTKELNSLGSFQHMEGSISPSISSPSADSPFSPVKGEMDIDEEDEDIILDDEASANMRQILARELGGSYYLPNSDGRSYNE